MKVVVAPDSWGGTLSAPEAAAAVAAGWRDARPHDEVVCLPLSDGGEGLTEVIAREGDRRVDVEVAGPRGLPVSATVLLGADGTAVVESALACGLVLLDDTQRDPLVTTTYGVGQLLEAARQAGARRILLGLGGSATVDAGAGALTALGFQLTVADGSGLKIGGGEVHRLAHIARRWVDPAWHAGSDEPVEVVLLADVTTVLADAAARFGPQKGASPEAVRWLAAGLTRVAEVVEADLAAPPSLRLEPGSGAAGGLGYGLAAAIGARFVGGAEAVAAAVGLDAALQGAAVVVTGEGRLDATTRAGKVVDAVCRAAQRRGVPAAAVVGAVADPEVPGALGLAAVEQASPDGPGADPAGDTRAASRRLAEAW